MPSMYFIDFRIDNELEARISIIGLATARVYWDRLKDCGFTMLTPRP